MVSSCADPFLSEEGDSGNTGARPDSLAEAPASLESRSSPGSGEEPASPDAQMLRVDPSSPEWESVRDLLRQRSLPYSEHYPFRVELVRIWQVRPGSLQRQQQKTAEALGESRLLFHGTRAENVGGILREGFRLPATGGMFGKGIYFADCPLKSVQFAQKGQRKKLKDWQGALAWLSGAAVGLAAAASSFGGACLAGLGCCFGGYLGLGAARAGLKALPAPQKMLVCEVFLGKSLMLSRARQVAPSDLQRGWLPKALGAEDYNSVYAPGGRSSAVKVPEYVVYQPHQAIPKYVIEFECKKKKPRA